MAEIKNLENELDRFRLRLIAAGACVLLAFGLLGARLWYLQVVRYEDLYRLCGIPYLDSSTRSVEEMSAVIMHTMNVRA